ncbi:universal stress protein [Halorussus salilacus]|uniref:universal stress protein n=1 Tax=Halorussus salilacus TaxID=2953750 RepID=UPI00209FDF1A|nr:universal stress protein [Halorussus salilacus]USZ67640.1 universal stress protein [Halorussus salilacus]
MSKKVLVPVDGSEQSETALEYALEEFPDANITAINVLDPIDAGYNAPVGVPGGSENWYENAKAQSETLLEGAQETADEYGTTLETATEMGRPSSVIVEYAEEEGFDQIIMGSHGRSGVSRILLGSVAETVVRRATMPVTVVR